MITTLPVTPISPLRQRMLEDMSVRLPDIGVTASLQREREVEKFGGLGGHACLHFWPVLLYVRAWTRCQK